MVQFACGRYAGAVKVTFRFNQPGSVAGWIWNRGQDLWVFSLPALIVLKLAGVIDWSWWWVLSPLWLSGILLAPVLCVLLALLGRYLFRRVASSEGLAAERYWVALREIFAQENPVNNAAPMPFTKWRVVAVRAVRGPARGTRPQCGA